MFGAEKDAVEQRETERKKRRRDLKSLKSADATAAFDEHLQFCTV